MFSRLTVAQRLSLGFGVILSLLIAVSLVGNNRVDYMNRTLVEASDGAAVKQRYAINFRGSVHDRAIAIRDAVLVEDRRALQQHLAEGDLDQRIETRYPESVMGALQGTMKRLADIIREVRGAAEELTGASAELQSTSDDNSQQIQLQAREAEQMAAAANQMAATVNEVAGFAANAASATAKADEEADGGNEVVVRTSTAIGNLAETLEQASQVVQKVSDDSGAIGQIIEVINGIAEQTNLLALNAAIEAARAGTHGRGFAVVADEVRSLASRTQSSTREIQEMIGNLQTGAGQASEEMEQSSVAEEVNRNISRIHDATLKTSAGSEQVAASSRDLAVLAEQLSSRVRVFRIRED